MRFSFYGTCLTVLVSTSLHTAQAAPSPLNALIIDEFNTTNTLVERGDPKAGDTNCHGSGACPILERNLFRAVKKFQNEGNRQYTQLTSRTDTSRSASSSGGVMVRIECDKDENYKSTGNKDGAPWAAADVVDAVLNKFYFVSDCGSCGSYFLDSHCQVTINYCDHCVDSNP